MRVVLGGAGAGCAAAASNGESEKERDKGGSVRTLLKMSGMIDAINRRVGRWCAWLILAAVAVSAANATVRKIFDVSSNKDCESSKTET